jgi:hypothetical protein
VLLPNTANQIVTLNVSGDEQISGEDFFAQVGDGGTFNGGANTKPSIQFATILSGTIFSGNNNGAFGDPGNATTHPLIWVDGTTTISGTVAANGQLAQLVFDTTGLSSGTFPLLLSGVASSRGSFTTSLRNAGGGLVPFSITNGSLIVATPTPGDFNLDGVVDSADYVTWRDGLGTTYTQSDYDLWRSHFGQTMGSGSALGVSSAVPEPMSLLLVCGGLAVLAASMRRR